MKGMIIGMAATSLIGGGAYASGAFDGGEVYNMPIEQVFAELEAMELPLELREGFAEQEGAEFHVASQSDDAISWAFSIKGIEIATFTAEMEAVSAERTRVKVHFNIEDPAINDQSSEAVERLNAEPFLIEVGEITFAEQLDATLENRPYDRNKVGMQILAYVATHPSEVQRLTATLEDLSKMGYDMPENIEWEPDMDDPASNIPGEAAYTQDMARREAVSPTMSEPEEESPF